MGSIIAEVATRDGLRLWSVPADNNDEALEIDGSTGIATRTVPVPPAAPIVATLVASAISSSRGAVC